MAYMNQEKKAVIATKPIPEEKEEFIKGLDNIKKKIDLTSLGPIPMNKEEIEQKTNLFK